MRKGMIALAAMAFMVISTSASALTVVDLIGDKDGFGIGAVDGSSFDWEAVGLTGDGDGTDAWMWGDYELTHTYDLTGFGSITYAELEIFTGGQGLDFLTTVFIDEAFVGALTDGDNAGC